MPPLISLVSGTYNRLVMLQEMVNSFRSNLRPGIEYEIVLVDGGSNDGTIEWAKAQCDVRLIEDGALLGAISAFTRGAFAAKSKYVLLANDDIVFRSGSIMPAIVYLETDVRCGALAFRDNRPLPGFFTEQDFHTLRMAATINGRRASVIYAQVGLFRKWIGDLCDWWGANTEMKGAHVYAGDNHLSAKIWRLGFTVEELAECVVEDKVARDELRQINFNKGIESNDSHFFYDQYPEGVPVMDTPQLPQQDKRAARIAYLPIYEPGWAVQKHPVNGKHGLRDALARHVNKHGEPSIVQEFDYLSIPPKDLRLALIGFLEHFKPDIILTQLQSPQPITADLLGEIRSRSHAIIVNWNGDQAPGGLAGKEMLQVLEHVDLQLITNLDVIADYERLHIKWAYWQIGYEEPGEDLEVKNANYYREIGRPNNPFDGYPYYPVVYLASLRSSERQAIADIVQSFGGRVFQPGDEFATLYNFPAAKYIYQHAKIAISDNGFTSRGFVSNRLFQALAAGGCCVFQQHVDGLDELTGLQAGYHYVEWFGLDDLRQKLATYTSGGLEHIAARGTAFVRQNFSFDAQVDKLFRLIEDKLGSNTKLKDPIRLKWLGGSGRSAGGLGNDFPSGERYEHNDGTRPLYVDPRDVDAIMMRFPGQWERE